MTTKGIPNTFMMEGTRCEEIETSSVIETKIKTESIIEMDSIFYEKDGRLVELSPELQEDFCAVMEKIKYEKTKVTEEIERDYTEPAALSETCQIPRSEQSLEFSRIISESTDCTPLASLCRLCATRSNSTVYMFSQNEMQNNIIEKIEYCFPLEVKKTDTLPKEVCHLCLEKLELCYQFHKTVEAAKKLFFTFDDEQCNEENYKYFSNRDAHSNIIMQKLPKTDTEALENGTILSNSIFRQKTYCPNRPNEENGTESSSDKDLSTCNSLLTFPLHVCNDMEEKLRLEMKPSLKEEGRNDKSDDDIVVREKSRNDKSTDDIVVREEGRNDKSNDDIVVREEVINKRGSTRQNIIGHELIKCQNCRETFETVRQYLAHLFIHGSKCGYFSCCLCGAVLRTEKERNQHRLEHKEDENLRRGEVQTNSGNESLKKSLRERNLNTEIKLNSKISSKNKLHCKTYNEDIDSEKSLQQRRQYMLSVHKQHKKSSLNMCEGELSAPEEIIAPLSKRDFSFECKFCNRRFRSNYELEVHEKTDCSRSLVSITKKFSCLHCGRSFKQKADLKSHLGIHTGERPYGCDLCGKMFRVKKNRDAHRRIHSNNRPYKCSKCEKSFNTSSARSSHYLVHSDARPYSCHLCHASFKTSNKRVVHLRGHTGEKPFKCSKCEKRFTTASIMRRHSLVHSDAKPYSCHLCHSSFKSSDRRDAHLRIHTGAKPFRCSKCEKRFTTRSTLRRHSLVHSDTTPYGCHLCLLSFKTINARDVHLRVHTGEKPYKCDICGICYTKNSLLLRHKRRQSCSKNWPLKVKSDIQFISL